MKKFLAIAVILVMTATAVNAQIKFGVKGGVNLTNMSLSSDALSASNRTGFYIGPTMKFTLPVVNLGMDISVLFDQREAKVTGTENGATYTQSIKNQTIAIPLNVRYNIFGIGSANLFAYAGPQIAFKVGSNYDGWTMRSSDFSGNIGLGLTISKIQINANYNIALGKTGDANLLDLYNATNVTSGITNALTNQVTDSKTHAWQIGVAYYF